MMETCCVSLIHVKSRSKADISFHCGGDNKYKNFDTKGAAKSTVITVNNISNVYRGTLITTSVYVVDDLRRKPPAPLCCFDFFKSLGLLRMFLFSLLTWQPASKTLPAEMPALGCIRYTG